MSSIWSDVRSDAETTDDLVGQLLAAAAAVGEALAVLDQDAPAIVEDWTGPHREAFDAELAALRQWGHDLAEVLLAAAAVATTLQAAAEGEQRLRVRLRQQALTDEACAPGVPC
jgi:uncharacterized protein YukE